ncbi:hypothetical protein ACFDR9_005591, partial [Janthinobacterium sp. CG_23.3]|uniref:hypothetical protein n=1 Tax=Janthinobacterium sp. CG_23.3 TaxID=3349634 RepID=UPI0038D36635
RLSPHVQAKAFATEPVTPSCTAYESGYPLPIRKSISIQNGIEPEKPFTFNGLRRAVVNFAEFAFTFEISAAA